MKDIRISKKGVPHKEGRYELQTETGIYDVVSLVDHKTAHEYAIVAATRATGGCVTVLDLATGKKSLNGHPSLPPCVVKAARLALHAKKKAA